MPLVKGQTSPRMIAAAKASGATGFLKAGDRHTVTVQSFGIVYQGTNKRDAERAAHRWTKLSQEPIGRAAGKVVTHTIIKNEH